MTSSGARGPAGAGDPDAWVSEPPARRRDAYDDYPERIGAWMARQVQPEVLRAVPALAEWPRASGRVVWWLSTATLRARDRRHGEQQEEGPAPLAMSALIPPGGLAGLLPAEDIAMLRAIEVPLDTRTPARAITDRLRVLEEIGPGLPWHIYRNGPAGQAPGRPG